MWRVALAVFGGWLGYSLAKTGKSRRNVVIFTASALALYKLTEWSMKSKAKVRLANEVREREILEVPPVEVT